MNFNPRINKKLVNNIMVDMHACIKHAVEHGDDDIEFSFNTDIKFEYSIDNISVDSVYKYVVSYSDMDLKTINRYEMIQIIDTFIKEGYSVKISLFSKNSAVIDYKLDDLIEYIKDKETNELSDVTSIEMDVSGW